MRKILAAVIAAAGLTFLCSFGVLASEVFQTVTSPSDGCSLVAVEGFYNSDTDVALDRINQIRYEACQEGVPDPGDPSKSLTPDDYVPIQWSSSLEYIARVRAAEASICRSHTRPNNQLCFTVTAPDGMRTYGENLAWNYSSTMFSGVNQWYREKTYWVTQDTSQESGHYTSMIDPDNRYVGLASFTNPGAAYPNTVSGEFDSYFTHNTDMLAELGDVKVILDVSTSALSGPTLQIRAQSQEHSGPPDRNDTIEYGLMLTATFTKGSGRVFVVGDITWSSSNPGVATVDGNGKAVINGVGETVIQAQSQSGFSATTRLRAAHSPQTIEGVAPTCTEPGLTEGSKCSVCGDILTAQTEIPATGHTEEVLPRKEPTCTETGLTEGKKCSVCEEILTAQVEIPALGHDFGAWEETVAPTCTKEGTKVRACSRCNETETETVPATGHTEQILPRKEPTCTETGLTEGKKCSVCEEILTAQVEIPALGHDFGAWEETVAPTCTKEGSKVRACSRCDETETETVPATGHTEQILPRKDPTCTETGLTEGKKCSVCGDTLEAQKELPALGHDFGAWEETVAPTCTKEGSKVRACSRCDETETETVPATGHTEQILPRKEPTCTETGLTEGKKCSVCEEILTAQKEIPALGHDFGAWEETVAPTCTKEGSKVRACSRCDESETETVPATGHTEEILPRKEPTCTETGLTEGKKCSVCEEILTAQVEIPALGHDFGAWEENVAPTCTKEGSKVRACSRCDETETETVPATGHTEQILPRKEPTCTETGLTEGKKCSVCGDTLEAQKELPALGHDFGAWEETVAPTCTKEGSKVRACSRCDETETETIPANGHKEEVIPGREATCVTAGLTEGKKCSVCGDTLEAQVEIPALGHAFGEWDVTAAPTCTKEGSQVRACSRCDVTETETIPATGHIWNAGEVTVAPTIESEGLRTYTCTECGEEKTEVIDKLTVEPDPVLGTVATLEERAEALSENGDPAGSTFRILQAKSKKVGKSAITIAWKPVPNAAGYLIFGAPCGTRYGKLDEVKAASFTQNSLKKGTYYKYFVSAYDEYGNILASSKTIHIATAGGKKGNTKAVRLNKKKVPLKTGKTFKLKATLKNGKLKVKKHRKVAFETDNPNVATVSGNGKIKAVGKGTCFVYAYAQNGVFARCKVTVK